MNRIWNAAETALLRKLATERCSASVIAHELNREFDLTLSRSAIAGRCARLEVKLRGQQGRLKGSGHRNEAMVAQKKLGIQIKPLKQKAKTTTTPTRPPQPKPPQPKPPKPQPKPLPIESSGYAFLDVPPRGCLYEIGNGSSPRDFRFCGHPRVAGVAYCVRHAAMVLSSIGVKRSLTFK